MITAVFIAAGTALTAGQLLVLQFALDHNIGQAFVGNTDTRPGRSPSTDPPSTDPPSTDPAATEATDPATTGLACAGPHPDGQSGSGSCGSAKPAATGVEVEFRAELAPNILRATALGDLGLLLGFAAVTAFLAWWLTRKALSRVGEVTALARDISEHDLSRRLHLPGRPDEIKELADTIDVMFGRLEQAFESQERFIANASHELRGPLTANRTALEAPLTQGRFPIDVQPSVLRALEANKRSERLITVLLQLARSRTVDEPQSDLCDLSQITAAMVEALADDAEIRGVRFETQLSGSATVAGHETLLTQAVFNLVDNAIRHNNEQGRFWVSVVETPASVRLSIENTGAVYTAREADQLTEPFHRGANTRLSGDDRHSLGLGLALVDSISRAHHGRLDLTPRPDGGLLVELTLPRTPTGDDEPSVRRAHQNAP